jgi:hypothetical protein
MQPEAKIGKKIREYLKQIGAFHFKIHGSAAMMAGLPDLIVCYQGNFIGIELKQPGRRATPRQEFVHSKIRAAGGVVIVADCVDDVESLLSDLENHA